MTEMTEARVQAGRAKGAILAELPTCPPAKYRMLAQDFMDASEAESLAHVREVAYVLHPKTPSAAVTLKDATAALRGELDAYEAKMHEITNLTGAIDAVLGAVLLFALA